MPCVDYGASGQIDGFERLRAQKSAAHKKGRRMGYSQIQNRILEILEPAQKGDMTSRVCDTLIALLVVFNILAVTLESVSDFSVK